MSLSTPGHPKTCFAPVLRCARRRSARLYLEVSSEEKTRTARRVRLGPKLPGFASQRGLARHEGPRGSRRASPRGAAFVTEPMQYGRTVSRGDAASLISSRRTRSEGSEPGGETTSACLLKALGEHYAMFSALHSASYLRHVPASVCGARIDFSTRQMLMAVSAGLAGDPIRQHCSWRDSTIWNARSPASRRFART